jgi:PAS domain S-box-containing protein
MTESLYFPLIFLAAIVGVCTALFAFFYRDRPGAKPAAVFAGTASVWAVVEGLRVAQTGLETMVLWTATALSLSVLLPPAWLLFVLEYTGSERRLTRQLFAAVLVEPLLVLSVVWTNDAHELVWSTTEIISYGAFDGLAIEFELAFWAHQVYATVLLATGAFLLVRMLLETNRLYQWQGIALLVAVLVPMSTNALYSFGLFPPGIDPTAISYVLASVVLVVTVLETELLGVAPATRQIGREAVLSELDDAMIILDDSDRIVDANPAGATLLGQPVADCLGRRLGDLTPTLAEAVDDSTAQRVELELDGKRRYYDLRRSELYRGYGTISGQVLSLRDITEQRQREQRLDVLNRLLRHNIRNELNVVRGSIELARTDIAADEPIARLEKATDAVDGIVARSDKLGRLSRMLDSEQGDGIDIARELRGERQTGGLLPAGGEVTLDLPETLRVDGGSALVAVFEELVSNAIDHNDSTQPRVVVRFDATESSDSHAVIEVSDNGPGIEQQELQTILSGRETALQHSSGVGLWLVNWVVERAGGTVTFENGDGCTVSVRLPRVQLDGRA